MRLIKLGDPVNFTVWMLTGAVAGLVLGVWL